MDYIIEGFNKIMQEYNDAYTIAKDEKERNEITLRYESIISEAEKKMDQEIEDFIASKD